MADWLSSLLAGLGSGAESLGASMSEREKRDAAAKQRNMELSNELSMKMAEYGLSPDVNLPTTAAVQGIGNVRMPTPDPLTSFAKQISLGQGTGKNMVASPRFDVFNGTEAATGDMSDAATNADMSGAGMRGPVSAYGAPTMPRTKLGMEAAVPDVQAQLGAPPMTTGAGDENLPRMSLIDPTTGQSTRYKRDITQSLPYLSMQAQAKANEEREQVKQDAEGRRLLGAAQEKEAQDARKNAAKSESLWQSLAAITGGKHPLLAIKDRSKITSDALEAAYKGALDVNTKAAEYHAPAVKYQIVKDDKSGKYYRIAVDGPPGEVGATFVRTATGGGKASQGAQSSLLNMLHLNEGLEAVENDPNKTMTAGQTAYEAANYGFRKTMSDPGNKSLLMPGLQAAVMNKAVKPDEVLQTYISGGRGMGEDVSQALKGRTSNDRVIRDIVTLTLGPSDWSNTIKRAQVQGRRKDLIGMSALAYPEQFANLPENYRKIVQGYIDGVSPEIASEITANRGMSYAPPPTATAPRTRLERAPTGDKILQKYELEPPRGRP